LEFWERTSRQFLRAFVACGWFGIQTWIGGEAINVLLATVWPHGNQYLMAQVLLLCAFAD